MAPFSHSAGMPRLANPLNSFLGEVWQPQAAYLPKMSKRAFSVNTDLLVKFYAH